MSPSASVFNKPDSQCFMLAVQHCPTANTTYICELQSPGLSPLRVTVSVTIIQGMWGLGSGQPSSHCPPWELPLGVSLSWATQPESKACRGFCSRKGLGLNELLSPP